MISPYTGTVAKEDINQDIEREFLVVKSNDLIQARKEITENTVQNSNYITILREANSNLTLTEQKIVLYLISRIKPNDKELGLQEIDLQKFANLCGISCQSGRDYMQMKTAISKLYSRYIWLETEEKEYLSHWLSDVEIQKNSGTIKLKLDEKLKPYLIQMHDNFTEYPMHNIIRMKSKYGIALYELLKSYSFQSKFLTFDIEDLKININATDYNAFSDFRVRVIEPALKDINTYSELEVKVEYIKEKVSGRRMYSKIKFTVKNLQSSKDPLDREEARKRYYNTEREIEQTTLFEDIE